MDFILISQSLSAHVKNVEILASILSDHSALLLNIDLFVDKKGPGFWKMDTSFLHHQDFKEAMSQAINQVIEKNKKEANDNLLSWEMIKNEIVGQTICYSARKIKEQNDIYDNVEKQIKEIENKID